MHSNEWLPFKSYVSKKFSNPLPKVISFKLSQNCKKPPLLASPDLTIYITLSGIVISCKFVQLSKHSAPILRTPFGIMTLLIFLLLKNAVSDNADTL